MYETESKAMVSELNELMNKLPKNSDKEGYVLDKVNKEDSDVEDKPKKPKLLAHKLVESSDDDDDSADNDSESDDEKPTLEIKKKKLAVVASDSDSDIEHNKKRALKKRVDSDSE